jgi:magnesium-transporting ATPase (P-type)
MPYERKTTMIEEREWHAIGIQETFEGLASNPDGLTQEEVTQRRQEFGRNEVERGKDTSWVDLLLHQIINPLSGSADSGS